MKAEYQGNEGFLQRDVWNTKGMPGLANDKQQLTDAPRLWYTNFYAPKGRSPLRFFCVSIPES